MAYQREYTRRLNVAVVGVGSHAYRNILPTLHHLPIKLCALCDINLELARATAAEYGVTACYADFAQMLRDEKLDAVLLVVGPGQHPTLAAQALDAGLHVWMEKPPGVRASEVEALLPKRKNHAVVVGFKKAHMPATQKAREWFVDGAMGPVRSILGVRPISIPDDGEDVLATRQMQPWLANGCHPLSFLLAVGGPVKAVTTFRARTGDNASMAGGALILEFANGAIGNLHLADGASAAQPVEHYSVFGPSAYLTIDDGIRVALHRGLPFDYGRTTSFLPSGLGADTGTLLWQPQHMLGTLENQAPFTQGTYNELLAFCDQALGHTPVPTTATDPASLEFAIHVMQVYEAALLSQGDRIAAPHGRTI